jgi:hypothetical protein
VLLRDLARGVGVARVKRRVLGHGRRGERLRALRAARLETAGGQVAGLAGQRPDPAVRRAVVGAFAVDDHRRREDQPRYAVAAHGLEQHRGTRDVDVRVRGQVGKVHAEPDQGGLVAHRVHPRQGLVHHRRVAHVADHELIADALRPAAMDGRGQGIKAAHLMAGRLHGFRDMRPDKTGRACH